MDSCRGDLTSKSPLHAMERGLAAAFQRVCSPSPRVERGLGGEVNPDN